MSFRKLELYGFKSFADKIEVEFGDGITAIVGPNGCGKSNVADSVRWVLGEQSAKLLRGKNMQDVIFNGTEKRRSLSFCEVSLLFDNKNRTFPIDVDEVNISRKLYRSGESEYSLNKAPCRLKDIVDLLHDTGIGKEGYCIVGQGKIDELLSAKPEDRRGIFEEAAGIAKYKARKVDAERKLERTQANLERVSDILGELKRQLATLEDRARDARAYLNYRDELKYNEVNSYLYQYDNASDNKQKIGDRLRGINEELTLRQAELEEAQASFNRYSEESQSQDVHINELRDEQTNLLVNAERIAGEGRLMSERLNNLKAENVRLQELLEKSEKALEARSGDLQALVLGKSEMEAELSAADEKLRKATARFDSLYDEIENYELEIEHSKNKIVSSMEELGGVKANLGKLMAEQDALTERYRENETRLGEYEDQKKLLEQELNAVQSRINVLEEKRNEEISRRAAVIARNNELQKLIADGNDEVSRLNGRVGALDSKLRMLEEMRKEYDGYQLPVKRLMKDAVNDRFLMSMIEGTVAQLIKVPSDYQTAIEAVLGQVLQNIVVKDEDDAKQLINHLKRFSYGRVTFLPISSMRGRVDNTLREVTKIKGCVGIASEIIEYDPKYDGVINSFLGRTVVFDNVDTAIAVSKKYHNSFRIVTLDGTVLMTSGAISGGSMRNDKEYRVNLLAQEENANSTKAALTEARDSLAKATAALEAFKDEAERIGGRLSEAAEALKEVDVGLAAERERQNKFVTSLSENTAATEKLKNESVAVMARIEGIISQIESVDALEGTIKEARASADILIEQRKSEFEGKRKEREELNEAVSKMRVEIQAIIGRINSSDENILRVKNECAALDNEIKDYRVQYNMNMAKLRSMESESLKSSLTEKEKQRIEEIKKEISEADAHKRELHDKMVELDAVRNALTRNIAEANDKKFKEETLLARIDTDIEIMQSRIWDEYQLTYSSALSLRDDSFDISGSAAKISKLKKQLLELGHVDVRAIEDYKSTNEYYTELDKQRTDLTTAKEDLLKIIEDLTNEMTDRFKTEFDKINKNFMTIFKDLFGGGSGKLVLQETKVENDEKVKVDPLEAGIDILAEPPGKRLQNISLLSGGERALTAIAILFAIMKLRPMPFCILDEIEAALDDSNAKLFASYLRKFTGGTQFIVITHRKPTMELADCLYGVTMQEKGVSKVVSVKLSDALKVAEPVGV